MDIRKYKIFCIFCDFFGLEGLCIETQHSNTEEEIQNTENRRQNG